MIEPLDEYFESIKCSTPKCNETDELYCAVDDSTEIYCKNCAKEVAQDWKAEDNEHF